jgi:hypothetical protein
VERRERYRKSAVKVATFSPKPGLFRQVPQARTTKPRGGNADIGKIVPNVRQFAQNGNNDFCAECELFFSFDSKRNTSYSQLKVIPCQSHR